MTGARETPSSRSRRCQKKLALAELLGRIGARYGRNAGETAVAWTLANPAVPAAIVGFRRPDQVEGMIGAGDFRLTPDEIAEIEASGA